jgi:hypothetical protein
MTKSVGTNKNRRVSKRAAHNGPYESSRKYRDIWILPRYNSVDWSAVLRDFWSLAVKMSGEIF